MTRFLLLTLTLSALVLAACGLSDHDLLAGPSAVQHLVDGRPVELKGSLAGFQSPPYSQRFDMVLTGRRSSYRISEKEPVFFSPYPGSEIILFRMEAGVEKDDRNIKGRTADGKLALSRERAVDLSVEREANGLFRVTPRGPLAPGEYAFVSQVDMDLWLKKSPFRMRVFDFGVD
ncbi:MAG TPA: hypothetical protein VJY35_13195 [Candidatus Eisenbacteria bacterium]|nr:hypothetical protein [Candidatus Eisenbacteria bacterium]